MSEIDYKLLAFVLIGFIAGFLAASTIRQQNTFSETWNMFASTMNLKMQNMTCYEAPQPYLGIPINKTLILTGVKTSIFENGS